SLPGAARHDAHAIGDDLAVAQDAADGDGPAGLHVVAAVRARVAAEAGDGLVAVHHAPDAADLDARIVGEVGGGDRPAHLGARAAHAVRTLGADERAVLPA